MKKRLLILLNSIDTVIISLLAVASVIAFVKVVIG